MKYTIGVDIGGTKIEVALVSSRGEIIVSHRVATDVEAGAKKIIRDMSDCISQCISCSEVEVRAVGIGIAGQIDTAGVVRASPNLYWTDVSVKKDLEILLDLPVFVINDVRAVTWGEWKLGAGKDVGDIVVLFVGTGIGGSVVSGGRVIEGCGNSAGELGHITIVPDGRQCRCPNRGCLEAYAGGWAIAERAQLAAVSNPDKGKYLLELAKSQNKDITAAMVSQGFYKNDPLSKQIIEDTIFYLGAGLTGILNAFNPCVLILGGGVIDGLPEIIPSVEKEIRKRTLRSALENLKVVKAELGGMAGVVGAAMLALECS